MMVNMQSYRSKQENNEYYISPGAQKGLPPPHALPQSGLPFSLELKSHQVREVALFCYNPLQLGMTDKF